MGDVVTALGRAVQDEGHSVEVIVPKYDVINYNLVRPAFWGRGQDEAAGWARLVWTGVLRGARATADL